jgi:hypothetical protein
MNERVTKRIKLMAATQRHHLYWTVIHEENNPTIEYSPEKKRKIPFH